LTFFSLLVMREDGTEFGEDFRKVGIGELGVVDQATTKSSSAKYD